MEWYESVKPYIALSVIGPALAMIYIFLNIDDPLNLIFPAVTLFVFFPMIMMGMYYWITGNGKRFINGINWSNYTDEEARMTISYMGFGLLIFMIAMMYCMCLLKINFTGGLIGIGISILLMIIIFLRPILKKISRPLPRMDSVKAISVFLIVVTVSLVPTTYLLLNSSSSESVDITLDDESFNIKSPAYDRTIRYDKVDDIQYYGDFDKGVRVMGYDDGVICSGKFKNDMFGNYELAAYKKVTPCIAISVEGQIYAFNQDSDDSTLELYNALKERISAA